MKRTAAFAVRNWKELVRDPWSYAFCLGFPLVMLLVMTLVNESIPAEAGMTLFQIENLSGGIAVFGLTFLMLFVCLTVSKDRGGAFLMRLYATPMTPTDFIAGYLLPTGALALAQVSITFAASLAIAAVQGVSLRPLGLLLALAALLPTIVLFLSLGLLFGTLFTEKAAPGLCSVVISFASFLGGVWFDVDSVGGILKKICTALPFVHCVKAARLAASLTFEGIGLHLLITCAYAAAVAVLAVVVFRGKMRADLG